MTPAPRNARRLKRRQPRLGKKTSVVWHFFKSLPMENGISRAACILCKVVFRNPGGSTTGMRGHLERKHPGMVESVLRTPLTNESHDIADSNHESVPPTPTVNVTPRVRVARERAKALARAHISQLNNDNDTDDVNLASTSQTPSTSVQSHSSLSQLSLPYHHNDINDELPEIHTVDHEQISKSFLRFLTTNLLPLDFMKKSSFVNLANNLNPVYMTEAGNTDELRFQVSSMLDEYYEEAKQQVRLSLQDKQISIAVDTWMKQYNETHLFVSCSYVTSSWTFESVFLELKTITGVSSSTTPTVLYDKLGKTMIELFEDYGIDRSKVVAIVYNAHPLCTNARLKILSIPTLTCFNSVVRESFDQLNNKFIENLHVDPFNIAKTKGKYDFSHYAEIKHHPGKLCQAMETYMQTNGGDIGVSAFLMQDAEACVMMQDPINSLVDGLMDEAIVHASTILPLISAVPALYKEIVKSHTCAWPETDKKHIVDHIHNFYQQSYTIDFERTNIGDTTLAICAFLDPRYKSLIFLSQDQRQFIHDKIIELLLIHFPQANESNLSEPPNTLNTFDIANPDYTTTTDPLNTSRRLCTSTSHRRTRLSSLLSEIMIRRNVATIDTKIVEEFKKYLDESSPLMNVNPFTWWGLSEATFPYLSKLAKKYLSIQGIASPANLLFTNAFESLKAKMTDIEPEHLAKIYFLHRHPAVFGNSHDNDGNDSQLNSVVEEPVTVKREPLSREEENDMVIDCIEGAN